MDFRTRCARRDDGSGDIGRPVAPPIAASSTFRFDSMEQMEAYYAGDGGFLYARYDSPTVCMAERRLAELEGADEAALFASGMAAISTTLLTLARAGDRIAAQREIYGGTADLLLHVLPEMGIRVEWLGQEEIAGVRPERIRGCRALYLETPVNPTLGIVDLERAGRAAREAGAVSVVDATFATPAFQRPVELGCDLVVHSGTKYLGGHADLVAGAVAGGGPRIEAIRLRRRALGGILDPFQAFLLHRGLRTLAVRMEAHERGARAVAEALAGMEGVLRVLWPGLPGHPGHDLARRQMSGFGGMVTFEVAGGAPAAARVHDRLRLFTRASSLGSVESLVSIPARVSHRYLTADERAAAGVTDGMVRLSVGLESPDDLVADLGQALSGA